MNIITNNIKYIFFIQSLFLINKCRSQNLDSLIKKVYLIQIQNIDCSNLFDSNSYLERIPDSIETLNLTDNNQNYQLTSYKVLFHPSFRFQNYYCRLVDLKINYVSSLFLHKFSLSFYFEKEMDLQHAFYEIKNMFHINYSDIIDITENGIKLKKIVINNVGSYGSLEIVYVDSSKIKYINFITHLNCQKN